MVYCSAPNCREEATVNMRWMIETEKDIVSTSRKLCLPCSVRLLKTLYKMQKKNFKLEIGYIE